MLIVKESGQAKVRDRYRSYVKHLAMALVLIAISFWIKGAYIFVKAELGQYLIARAWQQSLENTELSKPWFWADTWPLVRLRVPTQGVSLTVLAGDSGQALAFAPGHTSGSAQPGAKGVVIISGHRDTHFRFLQYLQVGDNIILQNWERQHTVYRVSGMQVVSEDALIEANNNTRSLVLVTCWPFDSFEPNSAQRFIVHAQAIDSY